MERSAYEVAEGRTLFVIALLIRFLPSLCSVASRVGVEETGDKGVDDSGSVESPRVRGVRGEEHFDIHDQLRSLYELGAIANKVMDAPDAQHTGL